MSLSKMKATEGLDLRLPCGPRTGMSHRNTFCVAQIKNPGTFPNVLGEEKKKFGKKNRSPKWSLRRSQDKQPLQESVCE